MNGYKAIRRNNRLEP